MKGYCSCPYAYHWSWKSKQCVRCPRGFVFFEAGCFYISSYPANFSTANQICKNYTSHLLIVKTKVIVDFLADFFNEFYLTGRYWVGALSSQWTNYWLDGCIIQRGPWWNYCNPTYYMSNATMNETLCISANGYGLEKTNCTMQLPFICKYGN